MAASDGKDILRFTGVKPGGDEFEVPVIDDGLWPGVITEVKSADFPDFNNPDEMIPKYIVSWATGDGSHEPTELAQFVKIPRGLIEHGTLSDKSNLYPFLKAIGIDPDVPELTIDPVEWLGREAKLLVENRTLTQGKNAGMTRPQITKLLPTAANASVAAQNAPQSDWQTLAVEMRAVGLVRADMEPLMGGFSEAHLLTWLLEEEGRSIIALCGKAIDLKAEARRVMAAATT